MNKTTITYCLLASSLGISSTTQAETSAYSYDKHLRLITAVQDQAFSYDYVYDRMGNQLVKYILSDQSSYTAPELDINYLNGGATHFEYDANSNLITLIDANHNTTRFEFNNENQLIKKIFADGSKIQYTYDQRLIKTQQDARGIETTYHYDDKKRLQKISYSDNTPEVTYTYNEKNQVTTITDGVGIHQYTYTSLGQLASIDGPWDYDTITYQYKQDGKLEKTTIEQGQTLLYQYDAQGRLTHITQGDRTFSYQYLGESNIVEKLTFPNNLVTRYQFDNANRPTRIDYKASDSELITYYEFSYNEQNLLAQEEYKPLADTTLKQEELVVNRFNELNQLVEEKGDNVNTPQFDRAGNMIKGITIKGAVFTAKYDAENRLTEITFTDQDGVKHKRQYKYFFTGFLAEIKQYQNNTLTQTTRFVREGNLTLQERDAENTVKRKYIWGLNKSGGVGGLLSLTENGQYYYYVYDGKGNIVGVVNQANEVVAGYHYEPFGKRVAKSGTFEQPYGFSTKRYDEETGLVYYGYRFYIPHQSIWLTRDPLEEAGGINLYGFVASNPIKYVDPLGRAKFDFGSDWEMPSFGNASTSSNRTTQSGKKLQAYFVKRDHSSLFKNGVPVLGEQLNVGEDVYEVKFRYQ
ncbi:RHS repeat domain-containing protein [Zooshikella ganghwensis]|uniref:RHS repeat domain-containing protein n=1 Tax=Zooshikella ganghwensis TaxID=202772 RepID=UPI0004883E57|nr:RHS repeat-associated core domain-containing protein [Zooshikella ganghwensis]